MGTDIEYEEVLNSLETYKQIAEGNKDFGPISEMDIPERFRWLAAVRSSIIQTSSTHIGKTDNLEETFQDRKSTRLNSSHVRISYAVFCLKKKKKKNSIDL